jgi:hypothetical protein
VIHRPEHREAGDLSGLFAVSTVFTGSIDTARDLI